VGDLTRIVFLVDGANRIRVDLGPYGRLVFASRHDAALTGGKILDVIAENHGRRGRITMTFGGRTVSFTNRDEARLFAIELIKLGE